MLDSLFAQDALLFTIPALLGTLVFLIKIGLMSIGIGDIDADFDIDVDVDIDIDGGDSTAAFSFISLQSIAAFIMGFGWGGLIGYKTFGWELPMSVLTGLGFGAFLMWVLGMMLKGIYNLQSSGTVNPKDAIGLEAMVYSNVPAKGVGRGKVRVVINDRARIYNAITEGEPLPSNSRVRVTRVDSDNTLTVIKA